ncbi:hypothetical protein HMPREF1497_1943 [Fusobacterium sp. CM21]|uniref:Restriction endonuclease n=1 Tax=Fusobacterium vincentii TaxID=155615 RepID=A0AAJ1CUU1_FUSVC|nr:MULTISPECIES: hypothetical protein [Fusobacterium]ETS94892.1 hypothetical protein HMPREF1497_1943 [Fusobacterium sp. CM21]MCW0264600.1 hypothetical protein [Fusobacterium vincentii]MDH2315489.1 hypothetical protein [Fusobacterium nucleatum]OHU81249.1 hypothetical protein BKN39_09040 [Fusobacterium nucleatum]STO29037.1 Uncharacterised protein [Fusobacterium vincentii]
MNKEIFELMDIFEKAKNKFLKEEKEIIKIDVNERTLSTRLMFHLQTLLLSEIYQESYKEYSVDCEYNRRKEIVKILPKEYRELEKKDKQIYPDIILHQRNSEKNLMIIEMKKTYSLDEGGKNENRDRLKFLTSLRKENKYKYLLGVYFEVNKFPDKCKIEFFVKEKKYDYFVYKSLKSKIEDTLNLIPFEEITKEYEIK